MQKFLIRTSHRPRPLPSGRWAMNQCWNDLLLAHWPIPAAQLAALLPEGLQIDTYHGTAWLGVVPFWLDRMRFRGGLPVPTIRGFPDLNLRTYVRDLHSKTQGIYCFSLDSSNLFAVTAARFLYQLPYHWAEMYMERRGASEFAFYSQRHLSGRPVIFKARYRGLGPTRNSGEILPGSLEYFLTERYCLFSRGRDGEAMRRNIHHVTSPLEQADAEIERNDLPAILGIPLPDTEPVLHYSRRQAVYIWPSEPVRRSLVPRPVRVAITPS